ncbi:MAG: HEAT repeat domain-containing protein [Phycisphaerae bacterium]
MTRRNGRVLLAYLIVGVSLVGFYGSVRAESLNVPSSGTPLPESASGALKELRLVLMKTTERYEETPDLKVATVQEAPRVLLKAAGVTLSDDAEGAGSAILMVDVAGVPVRRFTEMGWAYSGAEIRGHFEWNWKGTRSSVEFAGRVEPESEEASMYSVASLPSDAPFARALVNSGYVGSLAKSIAFLWEKNEISLLQAALQAEDEYVQWGAAYALADIGESALPVLRDSLRDARGSVQRAAALGLGRMGEPGLTTLRTALQDRRSGVREVAALGLGWAGQRSSVDALVGAMKDPSPGVRCAAVSALRRLPDPAVLGPLTDALSDKDAGVRLEAVCALEAIGQPGASALVAALKDSDGLVREAAAHAFTKLRDPAAVEPLVALLADPESGVRFEAIEALSKAKDERAAPALVALLKAPDLLTQGTASMALTEIGAGAVPCLLEALGSKDRDMRITVAETLGRIGDPRALGPLARLAEADPDMLVQATAKAALRKIPPPRSVEPK